MKVRLTFQKYGAMKFVGHLDVMRYFQKAFRRAGLDSEYTKGFNPHQIMSFAAPLGLGLTSDCEYVDIGLHTSEEPEIMIKKINEVMSEGFYVTGFHMLKDATLSEKSVTAMSLVSSADYLVSLKDGNILRNLEDKILNRNEFQEAFETFYAKPDITINKKTKKSEQEVNIKPMITMLSFECLNHKENTESKATKYENNINVYMQLDTGSASNLKPELVMEAFCNENGIEYNPHAWQVHRLEIYTRDEQSKKLIPLDRLEK
jgi:radical SAM-linked protein